MIAKKARTGFPSVTLVTRVVLGLIVAVNLLGGAVVWSYRAHKISDGAAGDLHARLAALQPLLAANAWSDPATLRQISAELDPIANDLRDLDSVIPFGGALPIGGDRAEHHALLMAEDVVLAAKAAIAAELVLLPALGGLEASALTAVSGRPPPPGTHFLTQSDVAVAQTSLNPAKVAMQGAEAEWQRIAPNDRVRLEQSAYGPFLRVMSAIGPRLDNWLQLESAVIDGSRGLLGVQTPAHLLLVLMDSSVPRPTGGAITHYALLTVNQGYVVPGVQLQPVTQLDCTSHACPAHPVPSNYQWMPLTPTQYGLGFSNMDPDFTVSAWSIFNAYTQEGGPLVSGIIAVTPAVLESALNATGPVTLPRFGVTVTATNLMPLMRQYDDAGQNGQQGAGADFDAAVFQAVGARLASLGPQERARLWHSLGSDLATKDIQLYAFNRRVEAGLIALNLAADVPSSQHSDDLFVVDTGLDDASVGSLVSEQISDNITLDKHQGTQHNLTITYHYVPLGGAQQGMPYDDLVRVIAAKDASQGSIDGPCTPIPDATNMEANHTTLACRFHLQPGQSLTIHFSWSAADILDRSDAPTYSLLVQRQAGAQTAVSVRIAAPAGYAVSHATASSGSPPREEGDTLTWTANNLTRDTVLSASLLASGTSSAG